MPPQRLRITSNRLISSHGWRAHIIERHQSTERVGVDLSVSKDPGLLEEAWLSADSAAGAAFDEPGTGCGAHARRSRSRTPATKSALQVHQVLRLPRRAQRRPRAPQLIQEALRTAPATKSALQEIYTASSRAPAATTRATAGPGGSGHCAPHEICTPGSPSAVPAMKSTRQGCKIGGMS